MEKKRAFDKSFEEKLAQALIVDHQFAEQMYEVMSLELLDTLHVRKIIDLLKTHFSKYEKFPSLSLVESMINGEVNDVLLQKKCHDFIERIKKNPLNGDLNYVKDKSLQYFRLQNIANCLSKDVLPRIESGENLEDIVSLIQGAVNKGTSRDIGYEYEKDDERRFEEDSYHKIPTGFAYFDKLLNGGFGAKRLFTAIAPSGAGKSHLLVNFGAGALLAPKQDGSGRIVVHYTLELDTIDTARRYDAAITGTKINDVVGSKTKVLQDIAKKLPPGAKLIIKEYPMKGASIQTIKAHLARLKAKDVIPDLIIIDYGDLMRAVDGFDGEKRHSLEAVWQDLKRLAQELEVPVVTATQTNRSGWNSDLITPDQVSEDFSKIMTSDIILCLSRNLEQKAIGIGKVLLAKNRQGEDGNVFAWSIDTSKCYVNMFELTPEIEAKMSMSDEETKAAKQEDIKNKLAQFINRNKNGAN